MRPHDSFERYYLEKVALGEGCGCAERVIREPESPIRAGDALRAIFAAVRTRWHRVRRHHAGSVGQGRE